jgi:hypothetical protein
MRHRRLGSLTLVLCCGIFTSTSALADPIQITGGQFTTTGTSSVFTFTGDGLSLHAGGDGGLVSATFLNCEPCVPTHPVPLSFAGSLPGGTLSSGFPGEFDGVSYAQTFLEGSFVFSGPSFSSAVLSADNLTFTAPFSMTATIVNYASSARFPPALFTASLFGTGTATMTFTSFVDPALGRIFDAESIVYEFSAVPAATPEPATLLLLGTGLAGLIARRRRAI